MLFFNQYYELIPKYHKQKSFYDKAYYSIVEDKNYKAYNLYSDNLKSGFNLVAKILIDKKHSTKSRYYITTKSYLLDNITYKHITDFLHQFYNHKSTLKKIIRRNNIIKEYMNKYALPLEQI